MKKLAELPFTEKLIFSNFFSLFNYKRKKTDQIKTTQIHKDGQRLDKNQKEINMIYLLMKSLHHQSFLAGLLCSTYRDQVSASLYWLYILNSQNT